MGDKKMKSSDWLILPIYRDVYPEHIYKTAKELGYKPQEIAENEGVSSGRTVYKAVPFDMLDAIFDVEQCEEDSNATYVFFGDEDASIIMVMWPIRKFIKVLDKFMQGTPKYRSIPETTQTVHFHPMPYPPAPDGEEADED